MPPLVLGISDDTTASVALLAGDRAVFAAANERFTRRKGDAGFPSEALDAALRHAGIGLDDVDEIAIANQTHFVYRLLHARFQNYAHDFFSLDQKAYLGYHGAVHRSGLLRRAVAGLNRALLAPRVGRRVRLCDHHRAHACAAVATAGFPRCLVVTLDNLGDGASAKVHTWEDGRLLERWASPAGDSPGQFYGEITQLLGFNPLRHAGKVTGLAGRGDPRPAYGIMRELFGLAPDGRSFRLLPSWARWRDRGPFWRLGLFAPEDVAAAAQQRLEDVVSAFVAEALRRHPSARLALAGGVTANVRLNMILARLPGIEAIHVHPAMSDEGLAWGAAAEALLARGQLVPRAPDHVFLGPGFGDADVEEALAAGGLAPVAPPAMAQAVARLLADGHTVARFDGRMEYGPRALGNRSILYRADDRTVGDWLNGRLRRTEFMPFAPVALAKDADALFDGIGPCGDAARFMTVAVRCRAGLAARCPAIVHVDGTARPQLVRREESPEYHDIVAAYGRLTGQPCLVNTSFNMHEEPIVCSPTDAVATFRAADLDFLAIQGRICPDPRRPDLARALRHACSRDQ